MCFQNQNQESSDGTQVPDGDGLSDTRIHKDGNDEKRGHAVSIMFFYIFCKIRIFFLQFMTYSVCYLSIRVQEKRDDTEEEALQNKGADSSAPQYAPNP